jgi:hypothetical protein
VPVLKVGAKCCYSFDLLPLRQGLLYLASDSFLHGVGFDSSTTLDSQVPSGQQSTLSASKHHQFIRLIALVLP